MTVSMIVLVLALVAGGFVARRLVLRAHRRARVALPAHTPSANDRRRAHGHRRHGGC